MSGNTIFDTSGAKMGKGQVSYWGLHIRRGTTKEGELVQKQIYLQLKAQKYP
jgi:hypothetical protein